MSKRSKLFSVSAMASALFAPMVTLIPEVAVAQENKPGGVYSFNIREQSLAGAIDQFSRVTDLDVLVDRDLVANRSSALVVGRMSAQAALERMTAGLGYRVVPAAGGFILRRAEPRPGPARSNATPADSMVDELVIVGSRPIAESESAAIEAQRNYPSIVSIVAADTVGRLPDQNIAFAVGRLPGIGVQRDQGQARYVNLRGAPINWTTISFDGINVVSPEGRTSRLDNIPSALAGRIEARKAVTPDMPGETLAGNINVVTRSPFDYKGFKLAAKAGLGYVALGGGEEYDGSIVISDTFRNDTIGVLFSASTYKRNMVTDNFEADWEAVGADAAQPGAADRPVWAREYENKLYRLVRRNDSLAGRIEWSPGDDHKVFFNSVYAEYRDDNEMRSDIKWDLDDRESSTPNTPCAQRANNGRTVSGGASGYADYCTGNTPTKGAIYGIDFDSNYNDSDSWESTWANTLGGDHFAGGFDITWRLNYTKLESAHYSPSLLNYASSSTRTLRPSIVYDFTDRKAPKIALYRTIVNADGSYGLGERVHAIEDFSWPMTRARRSWGSDVTDAYTAKIDATRPVDVAGVSVDLKFGAEYDQRTKVAGGRGYSISGADMTAAGLPLNLSAIGLTKPYLGDLNLGYSALYISRDAASKMLDRAIASGYGAFTTSFDYDVSERVIAGYAMGTVKFDWGNVILGVRAEKTTNEGTAPFKGGLATSSVDNTMVFPSAHLNWDLRPDMKLRVSLNSGAARADYDTMAPSISVDDNAGTASGGNPSVTPEKAYGVDVYYEWYLPPRGLFQLGVFYKKLEDVLFAGRTLLGDVKFPDGIDRSEYPLTTTVNGGEGEITGVEVAYQQPAEPLVEQMGWPQWLGGFGVQANATFTSSEASTPSGRKVSLPGTSDLVYNVIGYYEKYGLSARLSYQYRTDWLEVISDGSMTSGGDFHWDNDAELDFSVRYAVNKSVEWFFDASNLSNGPGIRYATSKDYSLEHETTGRRYMMGVRITY